ncbi:hypothetical protein LTR10_017742 [Elasticomyces elasticus]|nr:hypothetical protein LTR10_017742 [Elasticomyces elasticus]
MEFNNLLTPTGGEPHATDNIDLSLGIKVSSTGTTSVELTVVMPYQNDAGVPDEENDARNALAAEVREFLLKGDDIHVPFEAFRTFVHAILETGKKA